MKSFTRILIALSVLAAFVLFVAFPLSAHAQTAPTSDLVLHTDVPAVVAPAVAPSAFVSMLPSIIALITPIFSLVVTGFVRAQAPHIPGVFVPLIAAVCGLLPDLMAHYMTGMATNPVLALFLGLAATGLHQISAQLKPSDAAAPGTS